MIFMLILCGIVGGLCRCHALPCGHHRLSGSVIQLLLRLIIGFHRVLIVLLRGQQRFLRRIHRGIQPAVKLFVQIIQTGLAVLNVVGIRQLSLIQRGLLDGDVIFHLAGIQNGDHISGFHLIAFLHLHFPDLRRNAGINVGYIHRFNVS